MKKTFLFLIIGPMMMAQSVFETYKSNERVNYVSISPQMFSMLAKLNIDNKDPESKEFLELVSQINTFKLLRTDEPIISDDFSDWTQEYVKTNQLFELMQVREDQTTVYFFATLSEKENIVNQLVMLAQEDSDNAALDYRNQTVLLYIDGKIDLERIASLVQKLDIPAGEKLNKLKDQVKI
ncbi:MAG: DUF4252 domain-containing protein [Bacteroidota bacterium]|nr:DUF4252 domain-containing protein [Bacteroidota bacterium]